MTEGIGKRWSVRPVSRALCGLAALRDERPTKPELTNKMREPLVVRWQGQGEEQGLEGGIEWAQSSLCPMACGSPSRDEVPSVAMPQ